MDDVKKLSSSADEKCNNILPVHRTLRALNEFPFWNVNAVLTYISDPFGKLPTYRPANIIPRHLPLKIIKSHFV